MGEGLPGQEDLPSPPAFLRCGSQPRSAILPPLRRRRAQLRVRTGSAGRFDALAQKLKVQPIIVAAGRRDALLRLLDPHRHLVGRDVRLLLVAELRAAPRRCWKPRHRRRPVGAQLSAFWESQGLITKRGFPSYPNLLEGFPGVACSDTDNPHSYAAWSQAASDAEAQFSYFGPPWTWASSICAAWPGGQGGRYTGPFTANTTNTVLVASTQFDPATRYEGAVTVAGLLPNARLLTVHGWGHTTLFLSQCADQAVAKYLLTGAPPPEGLVCEQDLVPFTFPASATVGAQAASGRARLLPVLVPDAVRPRPR